MGIKVKCCFCEADFYKKSSQIKKFPKNFCTKKCYFLSRQNRHIMQCNYCGKDTIKYPYEFTPNREFYCSYICHNKFRRENTTKITLNCDQCKKIISKFRSTLKKTNFCTLKCRSIYHHAHKPDGYKRSKLERYIEQVLKEQYKSLKVYYNTCGIIGGLELDIFIPSLNLAFELNGPTHYKPIFGDKKLQHVKANDAAKRRLCKQKNIRLYRINTSTQSQFTIKSSQQYLSKVLNTIKEAF